MSEMSILYHILLNMVKYQNGKNTEACEQTNAKLRQIATSCTFMNPDMFMTALTLYLGYQNLAKTFLKKNIIKEVPPALLWIEVKKPGMEEPVGEMEERGEMEEMEERGALKPVFREAGVQLLRILQQSRCPLFGHLML